jgi:hypothetical protein
MSNTNTTSPAPSADTGTLSSAPPGTAEAPPLPRRDAVDVTGWRIESANQEFEFYYRWSLDERKGQMRSLVDSLRHLTNLAAALLAGSLTFLTGKVCPWCQGIAAVLLLGSLCCGLVGAMPGRASWRPNEPMTFHRAQEHEATKKAKLFQASAALMGLGFAAAIIGWAIKTW